MAITKKKDKYYCRFQIKGERHHYLCKGAKTKQEAEQIEAALKFRLMQQQNGVIPREDKKKPRLKQLKESFLTYSKINRSVYKQDIGRLNIIFEFFSEDRIADTVVRRDVENFKLWLLEKGRSKKTINLYIGILRIMFNLAIENEWLTKNPFKSDTEFKLEPRKMKYLADNSQSILDKNTPDYFAPIITIALNTGLRKGNIIDLRWEDIDFNFKTIEITKNKGNKHIKLPMNDTVYNLLLNLEHKSEYVFLNPFTGEKWRSTSFNKHWRNIRAKSGLGNFKFHGLRHTFCTRLMKNSVPTVIVKELMTHTDLATTMQYVHIDSLDMVKAVNVLNSYN